jgi:hypothetical protein
MELRLAHAEEGHQTPEISLGLY